MSKERVRYQQTLRAGRCWVAGGVASQSQSAGGYAPSARLASNPPSPGALIPYHEMGSDFPVRSGQKRQSKGRIQLNPGKSRHIKVDQGGKVGARTHASLSKNMSRKCLSCKGPKKVHQSAPKSDTRKRLEQEETESTEPFHSVLSVISCEDWAVANQRLAHSGAVWRSEKIWPVES